MTTYRSVNGRLFITPSTPLEAQVPEDYMPANWRVDTLPVAAVNDQTEVAEPAVERKAVEAINQDEPAPEAAEANAPLRPKWAQQRRERLDAGETRAVRRLRQGSAEAERVSEIADPKVIRKQSAVDKAAELEDLAEDPRAEAYSNRRARFWLLLMAATGIALGVGISASTAQQTIATFMGWQPGTLAFLAAYGADPALGLVLFATLGARILASARGVAIPERAREALNRIELLLFVLIAVLNAGPSLGALIADAIGRRFGELGPDVMVLVIHTLGPVLVATGVFGVPFMALILGEITAATNAKRRQVAAPAATVGAPLSLVERRSSVPTKWHSDFDRAVELINAGTVPVDPSGSEILRHLGGDASKKPYLRQALAGYRPLREVSAA
ncbi:hypothetical protein EIL87_19750 [Saccharopolyspora rhizosphaerae]|uniref:Uncharacterized protein n=1 Tax=Saccharopolyspora rhizosphaerae TaxID=2492662 RepID=A0A3R8NW27_9PSEU|nr:hypothetical protein [Saccharopolyspora rhizosphaerae]RRO14540.1 hypothetical protein EIL87_19750 [Saccharopolyspora rhizosphaerae]